MKLTNRFAVLLSILAVFCSSSVAFSESLSHRAFSRRPKLVVVLVIDQFRADYLTRFEKRFLPALSKSGEPGGFRYLMEKGAYYPFAEYEVFQNMTCPGHATILTGAHPTGHKISLNAWFDAETGKSIYCTDDENSPVIGATSDDKRTGVSPKRLKSTTVGDELKNAGHESRVVALALKDRSAVMLGGHRADLAFWFDFKRVRWTSSRYYLENDKLPDWLGTLNENLKTRKIKNEQELESSLGIEVTTEAAIAALKALKLGTGKATDILAISYSAHDMLGHEKGPNAKEMEDLTIGEDRSLAELFKAIDKSSGLKNTVVVLTADHGIAPTVAYASAARLESGGVKQDTLKEKIGARLSEKFGKPAKGDWVSTYRSFNFYLNRAVLAEKKVALEEAQRETKRVLEKEPAADAVVTETEFRERKLPPGPHATQLLNSFVPGVNGDVVMIPKPFFVEGTDHAVHMSGYSYDRTVPVILAGPHLKAAVYARPARVVDIAPTLSFLLGVIPPARNEGRVLSEAISD